MINTLKTVSAVGTELCQKIQIGHSTHELAKWYLTMFQNRTKFHKAPASIHHYKQSYPYCLTLHNISGLTVNRKSNSSSLFINLSGMIVTQNFTVLGIPFHHQCESSLGRNQTKWETPLNLYFHSRIDKNVEELYLLIRVKVNEIKDSIVESVTEVGTMVIKQPFIEESNKSVSVYKELSQQEFGFMSHEQKEKYLAGTSTASANYTVEAALQLKKLTKMIPENSIFTCQDPISGIRGNYLPSDIRELALKQSPSVQLTIRFLQVHISERFEQDLSNHMRRLFPKEKSTEIKSRKMAVGYHNQYCLVNGNLRKLQFLDRWNPGDKKINIYENIKEGEVIKVPFYVDSNSSCGAIVVGLIYEINQKQIQVASYFLIPNDKGEEVSEQMLMGSAFGAIHHLTSFPTNDKPTLIMEYECQLQTTQHDISDGRLLTDRQIKSRNLFVDQDALAKEKQKLQSQIEKERLQIMQEKQQMEKLKNQNYMHFQTQFERKFENEKESLYKRQQMIENQYREQVEKQIRERFELEEEIKKMTQKLKHIEEENYQKVTSSPAFQPMEEEIHPGSPRFRSSEPYSFPNPKLRMDPGYIIEPENPVPVKKVRQIIEKGPKVTEELIKQSEDQFNYASKFSFTFISIVWSNKISPPKDIYLVIRFFNQERFRTDSLGYLETGQSGYHQLIRTAHFAQGYDSKEPTYAFTVDPSQYHQPHMLQKDLTRYLAHNSVIIDVFSGESHLYVGQINIKLKELVRGTKTQTLIAKEVNLVRLKDKQNLGIMQVLIRNEQVNCKDLISVKEEKKVKDLRKKVVSNNPIFISAQDKMAGTKEDYRRGQNIKGKSNAITRQELRIQKFKEQKAMKTFSQTTNGFQHLQQPEKATVLHQIMSYKQQKMEEYIKGVYADLLNEQINMSAHFGKAVTFPYLFQNTSQSPAAYKISIMQVGSQEREELSVVKSNKEWRFLVAQHNYSEPKRYDIIGQNNTFFLHPGQSIPLIFKFLAFSKDKQGSEKIVNVTICKEDNNWIAGGFSLLVQMHEPIIHHSYILYEPGEQMVDIIVPVIYSQTQNTSNPKKLHLTDSNPSSSAQWLNPYEILVRIETPKIMQRLKFNLLLYNDQYFCDLSQNWLIEIYSYEGVCAYFRSDFNTKFKITMPWSAVPAHLGIISLDRANSGLKLHASSPALIFKDNLIEVDSDRRDEGGCEIWCQLLGGENARKSAQVTCVSGEDDELIYGWTVTVYPYVSRY